VDTKINTWNIEASCKTGALKILIPQLKQHYIYIYIYSYKTVGRASSQAGEISYTKQSPATNISHQEKGRKFQKKMGRWNDRRCRRVACYMAFESQMPQI
jgi:hypothetical protein